MATAEEKLANLQEQLLRENPELASALGQLLSRHTASEAEPEPTSYTQFVNQGHSDDSIPIAFLPSVAEIVETAESGAHQPEVPIPTSGGGLAEPSASPKDREKITSKKKPPAAPAGTKSLSAFGFGLKQVDPTENKAKGLLFQPFQVNERRSVPARLRMWEREGFQIRHCDEDVLPTPQETVESLVSPELKFAPSEPCPSEMMAVVTPNDRLAFLFSQAPYENDDDLLLSSREESIVPRTTEVVFVGMYSLRHSPYEGRPPYFGTSNVPAFLRKEQDGTPRVLQFGRFAPTTEMRQLEGDEAPDYEDDSGEDWDSEPSDADDAMKDSSDDDDEYSEDESDGFINDNPSDVDSDDGADQKAFQHQKRLEHILRVGKLIPKAYGSYAGINLPAHPQHFKKDFIEQLPLAQQESGGKNAVDSISILEGRQEASCDGVPPSVWTSCNTNGMMPTLADAYYLLLAEEMRRSGLAPRADLSTELAAIHSKLRAERAVNSCSSEHSVSMMAHSGFDHYGAGVKGTGVKVPIGLLQNTTPTVFEMQEEDRRTQDALKNKGAITEEGIQQLKLFVKGSASTGKEKILQEASRLFPDVSKKRLTDLFFEHFVSLGNKYLARDSLTDTEREILKCDGDLTPEQLQQLKMFAENEPIKAKRALSVEAQRISPLAVMTRVNQTIDNTFVYVDKRWRAKDLVPEAANARHKEELQSSRLKAIEARTLQRQRDLMDKVVREGKDVHPSPGAASSSAAEVEDTPPPVKGGFALSYLEETTEDEDAPLALIFATSPTGNIGAKRPRSDE